MSPCYSTPKPPQGGNPGTRLQAHEVDWEEAQDHVAQIGLDDCLVVLAVYPPDQSRPCIHIPAHGSDLRTVAPRVERILRRNPEYSLGVVVGRPKRQPDDWGAKPEHLNKAGKPKAWGASIAHIESCSVLVSEADGGLPIEEQCQLPARAGLPDAPLQIQTGGKSVHSYWPLTPGQGLAVDEFRDLQRELCERQAAVAPEAGLDRSLVKPNQVMRLAGSVHPRTGQRCRIIKKTGETFSVAELRTALPITDRRQWRAGEGFAPSGVAGGDGWFSKLPADVQRDVAAEMLAHVPQRGEPGSGTYQEALLVLAQLVHHFGPENAVSLARDSGWEGHHWDVTGPAASLAADYAGRRASIGGLIHRARDGGWSFERSEAIARFNASRPRSQRVKGPRDPVLAQLRSPDVLVSAGAFMGQLVQLPLPQDHTLVALKAAMGTGKTVLIDDHIQRLRELNPNLRVIVISHRNSLAQALGGRLGLPFGDAAAPGSPDRNLGMALCIDSLCPESGKQFRPEEWVGAVVVIDEALQVANHLLCSTGTEVARRRASVVRTLELLIGSAAQVVLADAHLNDAVLRAYEVLCSVSAHLIQSEHRTAAGRALHVLEKVDFLGHAGALVKLGNRLLIWTAAQRSASTMAAVNIESVLHGACPDARILVVDSVTVATAGHPAARFASDPNGVCANYDIVICTPALTSGVSIDTLPEHFDAVFLASSGAVPVEDVVQAAGRLRTNAPRYLLAAEVSPGNNLRMGSGESRPDRVRQRLERHEQLILEQLARCRAGITAEHNIAGPWVAYWCELAALRNQERGAYRNTIIEQLKHEGYVVTTVPALAGADTTAVGEQLKEQLKFVKECAIAEEDQAIQFAPLPTPKRAAELLEKKKRTPDERAELDRFAIDKRWGLNGKEPTGQILQAEREGLPKRLEMRHWLTALADAIDAVDVATVLALTSSKCYVPTDLIRRNLRSRIDQAKSLGILKWIDRVDEFQGDDAALYELQSTAEAHRGDCTQILGLSICKQPIDTLRSLLRPFGYEVESRRVRVGGGKKDRLYRVASLVPPAPYREKSGPPTSGGVKNSKVAQIFLYKTYTGKSGPPPQFQESEAAPANRPPAPQTNWWGVGPEPSLLGLIGGQGVAA